MIMTRTRKEKYAKFRAEADSCVPHLTHHEKHEWAMQCVKEHPGFKRRSRIWTFLIILLLILLCVFLVRSAHGAPVPARFSGHDAEGNFLHYSIFPQLVTLPGAKFDASGNLDVNCIAGCVAGGSFADNSAFTAGTTPISITGGWYSTSPTNCTTGSACAPQLSQDRKLFVEDFQGTSPWTVKPDGTAWALTGTSANVNVTNTVTVSGTVTANAGTGQFNVTCTAANCPINLANEGGTAITNTPTAIGTKGSGNVMSVNSDTTSIAGTATVTAAAGVQKVGIVGNANAAVDAANNASPPANNLAIGAVGISQGTQPTAITSTNMGRVLSTTEGALYVQQGNSNRFSCFVAVTSTATTQCQAAPAAGLRAYVTSAVVTDAVTTAQAIDIVYGTGSNCGTGTTALTAKWEFIGATETGSLNASQSFLTPLIPAAANAICCRPSNATAFGCTLTGYIAP